MLQITSNFLVFYGLSYGSVDYCTYSFNNLVDYNRHFLLTHSKTIIQKQKRLLRNKEVVVLCILERQVENAEEYIEHLKNQHDEKILCKLCCHNKRNMIFQPCNHIYSCVRCGSNKTIIKCPVCKKRIKEKDSGYIFL